MQTSPHEREILTHYWTTPGPWKNGSENWNDLDRQIVDKLIVLRLLSHHENGGLAVNAEAVGVYMQALAEVPYPVLRWVMPPVSESGDA